MSIRQLSSKIGVYHHQEGSDEYQFNCPYCIENGKKQDKKRHLYVNIKKERFICFRCGERGSLKKIYQKFGIDVDEEQVFTLDDLRKEIMGLSVKSYEPKVEFTDDEMQTLEFPCETRPIIKGSDAYNYMILVRKFDESVIERYKMVYGDYFYSKRVFIPTFSKSGRMVYWVARSYFANEGVPRYVTPNGVHKACLFNFHFAKQFDTLIICEGVLSAIAAGRNAVASFGKSLTNEQKQLLLSHNFKEYIVSYDGDARQEAVEVAQFLKNASDSKVSIVNLKHGDDPDSVGKEKYEKLLEERSAFNLSLMVSEAFRM